MPASVASIYTVLERFELFAESALFGSTREVSRAARGRDIAVSSPTHMPSTMKLGALTFKSLSVYVLFKGKQPAHFGMFRW